MMVLPSFLSGLFLVFAVQCQYLVRRDCTFSVSASAGDTCSSLASYWGITLTQFQSYNPGVDCNKDLTANTNYCIEWDDGQPPPTSTTTTSSTTSATLTTPSGPSPTQTGITSNCDAYYKVVSGDTCQKIVKYFGNFTLTDFYNWNMAVGSDCSQLFLGFYYCVGTTSSGNATTTTTATRSTTTGPPQPEQTGIISTCTSYYKVGSGDTCSQIVDKYGTFTLKDFLSWNPAVGSDCSQLFIGYYVCVGIPGTPTSRPAATSKTTTSTATGPTPTQTGVAANCNSYYLVKSSDSCQKIIDNYGNKFTLKQFYIWNPAVGSDCSKLWVGYYVCVGVRS
ncbi:LysM domain-containing protein [Daldinia vernicosa]|uniref:LysM domain-containing protein n=1 Tax=Daldinia vernicosa TaxID=114800 RepID=UPI0020089925|nr:LysM domain-containing protein [Daldinia vernicosa]KAI0847482.1 LysM domain-containing protein [Daldinia vernicosa]